MPAIPLVGGRPFPPKRTGNDGFGCQTFGCKYCRVAGQTSMPVAATHGKRCRYSATGLLGTNLAAYILLEYKLETFFGVIPVLAVQKDI